MMSKKYKGKLCVYCGCETSTTGDHVIAREFFDISRRDNLLKVPSCFRCNNQKSKLEHYLTTILPFGSNSDSAREVFVNSIEKRLDRNLKLKRHLSGHIARKWSHQNSGICTLNTQLPIREEAVVELFEYMTKGLIYHHFGVVLSNDYFVQCAALTEVGVENLYRKFIGGSTQGVVYGSLANKGFVYAGRQGVDYPEMTVWFMRLYDGVKLVGNDSDVDDTSTCIFGMSGHRRILENAYLRKKFGI